MKLCYSLIGILGLAIAAGCGDMKSSTSFSKAEIDKANDLIRRYGLASMPTYEQLLAAPSVVTKNEDGKERLPWIDSYWPTNRKGLVHRWGFVNSYKEPNQNTLSDFQLGAFFSTQELALNQTDDIVSVNLSPAEKFDILYRQKKGLPISNVAANLPALEAIDQKQREFVNGTLDMGAIVETKRTWAKEYLSALSGTSNSTSASSPMTTEGLKNWLAKASNPRLQFPGTKEGIDWSWEGICHGWAIASLMAEEPKHAVRVALPTEDGTDKFLYFMEGDIRALLSRAWAEDAGAGKFFVGRRCNKNTNDPALGVPTNEEGRAISGSLDYQLKDGSYRESPFTIVQDYPLNDGTSALYRIILEKRWTEEGPRFAYLINRDIGSPKARYVLSFNEKEAFAIVESDQTDEKESRAVKGVELYGCWDVNPASFHTLLVKNIGERNTGVVMDRSQEGQVWNQPVGRADFQIGELQLSEELGNDDKGHHYRAPGTVYIAKVEAKLKWGQEPSNASFTYVKDGRDLDQTYNASSSYSYTLEFDKNKRLIGGEWGDLTNLASPKHNPDFVYGYKKKAEPSLNQNRYIKEGYEGIIKKLHACSLTDNPKGKLTLSNTVGSVTTSSVYAFSSCVL